MKLTNTLCETNAECAAVQAVRDINRRGGRTYLMISAAYQFLYHEPVFRKLVKIRSNLDVKLALCYIDTNRN
jgi:hypothetical protein